MLEDWVCVEVREPFVGVGSTFCSVGPWNWTQVARIGSRCLFAQSHLDSTLFPISTGSQVSLWHLHTFLCWLIVLPCSWSFFLLCSLPPPHLQGNCNSLCTLNWKMYCGDWSGKRTRAAFPWTGCWRKWSSKMLYCAMGHLQRGGTAGQNPALVRANILEYSQWAADTHLTLQDTVGLNFTCLCKRLGR